MTRAKPDVADINNDGKLDIILGMERGNVVLLINEGTKEKYRFDKIVVLKNKSGKAINAGSRADVKVYDWNKDGKPDIVASTERGKINILLNIGSAKAPKFDKVESLYTKGWPLLAGSPRRYGIRFSQRPRGDAIFILRDGTIKNFKGVFVNAAGKRYVVSGKKGIIEEADFNKDGIPDLLIGRRDGRAELLVNKGVKGKLEFEAPIVLKAEGKVINGGKFAQPRAIDFDKDGKQDLVVISQDGKTVWYKNTADKGAPVFKFMGNAKCDIVSLFENGVRSRLDIFDWNNDGKMDLIYGAPRAGEWSGKIMVFPILK